MIWPKGHGVEHTVFRQAALAGDGDAPFHEEQIPRPRKRREGVPSVLPRGKQLPGASKATHALALGLVALSTILLRTPAAYHRIVYGGEESDEFLRLGSGFVMAATVALALGLTADVYVVIAKIAGSQTTGMVAAAVSLAALLGLWHVSRCMFGRSGKVPVHGRPPDYAFDGEASVIGPSHNLALESASPVSCFRRVRLCARPTQHVGEHLP